jgi:NAD(P)-dependent dehydrogenase (short-subunit alcohol dehydrogenase family)
MSPVAVITGSTRGIGLGLARELRKRGCQIVITGRNGAAEVGASLGDDVLALTCDVTDPASVQAVWDATVERFGRVDIWINNAGTTTIPVPLWDAPLDEIKATLDTNILGTINGCRVAIAGMRAQSGGGRVYNVEGMGSKGEVQAGMLPYATTKAAVGYLDKALQKELKGSNVALISIRPGINVTSHLLHGSEHLPPERWEKTKKVFNILGDKPETTTPWLAEKILATTKSGAQIAWLTPMKITGRFMTASFRKRDLFGALEDQ